MSKKKILCLFIAFCLCLCVFVTDYGILMNVNAEETTIVTTPTGKKGIIASYWTDEGSKYQDDPIALGVDHALFNIDVTHLVSTDGTGEAYTYNGKTYYFQNVEGTVLYFTFLRMQQIRDKGIALTVQVNMQWSDDPKMQEYIFPSGREPGHNYYALNTSTAESREKIAAALHYLVYKCPYVNNWIVGCEINSPEQCNYCGTIDVATNVTIAVQTYDLMYQAIQDLNPAAKNYVCLDNIWNFDNGTGIPAKKFLEEFAKLEQDKVWHLAYHPYPVPYGSADNAADWNMWAKKSAEHGYLEHTEYTGFMTGANIEQLSKFVKDNYGEEHRIILTEFGFDARAGEDAQAAALYYTYKAAERDPMIDACIYQPWTDTGWDFRNMGILDKDGNKRKIYNVFKYMDVDEGLANASYYKEYLGIEDWSDNIIYDVSTNSDLSKTISSVYIPESDGKTIRAGAVIDINRTDLVYECVVIDYDCEKYGTPIYPETKRTYSKSDNWMTYTPTHPGKYGFIWRAYDGDKIVSEAGNVCMFTGGSEKPITPSEPDAPVESLKDIITGVYIPNNDGKVIKAGAIINTDRTDLTYECTVIDYDSGKYLASMYPEVKKTTDKNDNWMVYTPKHPGMYGFCWRAYKDGKIVSEYGATHYFGGNEVKNVGIWVPDRDAQTLSFGAVYDADDTDNVRITWFLYRPDDNVYEAILSDGVAKDVGSWQTWTKKPGRYWIMCRVTSLNNEESSLCWGVEVRNGVVIDPE